MAVLLADAGWPVKAVWSRRPGRSRTVASRVEATARFRPAAPTRPEKAAAGAGVILLAVPDDALAALAVSLAAACQPAAGTVALHLSGAAPVEVLAPLRQHGVRIGALHPLAVFSLQRPPRTLLEGAGFAVGGDPAALRIARRLARSVGGIPYGIPAAGRSAYHLAASLVANDTLALFAAAMELSISAGLSPETARRVLANLLAGAARFLAASPPGHVLTGAVSRGDVETVRRHLRTASRLDPAMRRAHVLLSRRLLRMAREAGRLDTAAARRLERLLRDSPG
jgi:predicted short-subunit dehydrogenase-like oxidoreductase (DUF2520 family)